MIFKSPISCFPWDETIDEQACPANTKNRKWRAELWLAINLPKLALELVAGKEDCGTSVVIEEENARQFVHIASDKAEQAGIHSGMPLAAAYSICSGLHVYEVDYPAQQQRLQQLANWALQLSPRISLYPPCSLIIEVAGSVSYFGSLEIILEKIRRVLTSRWRHVFYMAVSPAPEASLLLARSGNQVVVTNIPGLRSAMGGLGIELLPLDKKSRQQLGKIGVHLLRDIWRLPPAALARRFGIELVEYLDRITGKSPSILPVYSPPERFHSQLDIPSPVQEQHLLIPGAAKLLHDLCSFLESSDTYTDEFLFYFQHRKNIPTVISISLRQALRDREHFMMLFETKLQQEKFCAPVTGIRLVARTLLPYTAKTADLFSFASGKGGEEGIDKLLDQLHTRLDRDTINGLASRADHRPEYASIKSSLESRQHARFEKNRPFWLLPEPRLLGKKNDCLYYRTIIKFIAGPERIETGWWDGIDIRRDYYIGIDESAGRLWIYNDLRNRKLWYLHGLFG